MAKATVDVASFEWAELGERLRTANPACYGDALRYLRLMVEGSETVAQFDDQLMLRARRPTKRYAA